MEVSNLAENTGISTCCTFVHYCQAQRGQQSRPVGSTISASVYIYLYVRTYDYEVCSTLAPGGKARVQNGVSGSFLSSVIEVVADKKSEVWTN